uniref:Uncharacterized protein n=1 Tax=Opuntia streptacantha TaxID=393608 RepID=A0A7C8YP84_OPUST
MYSYLHPHRGIFNSERSSIGISSPIESWSCRPSSSKFNQEVRSWGPSNSFATLRSSIESNSKGKLEKSKGSLLSLDESRMFPGEISPCLPWLPLTEGCTGCVDICVAFCLGLAFVFRSPFKLVIDERPPLALASLSLLFPLAPPKRADPRFDVGLAEGLPPTSSSNTSFFLPLFNIGPFLAKAWSD